MAFDAISYINEPRWRNSSLGLERITLLLEKLGNPQDSFRAIHVAGTNGKGSVCAYLASILRENGARTGLFTSPYVERFEERIQIDGEMIGQRELHEVTLRVRDAADEVEAETGEHPTEFELMCAVAFVHFANAECDVAVIEVGLGGRLDATNVVCPELGVIARIGMDHTDILGDTLCAIATEKAGIIKPGVPVVSWPHEPEAMEVIRTRCEDLNCKLIVSDFDKLICRNMGAFEYKGKRYETQMLAAYQPYNAALAIDAANVLGIKQDAIERGVANATWPGRFEIVCEQPLVIIDGAHNPQGAAALSESLNQLEDALGIEKAPTFVMGVLADKDYVGIIEPLLPMMGKVITYAPENPRALPAEDLASAIKDMARKHGATISVDAASSPDAAIDAATKEEGPEGFVVAFGTLYAIGSIKQALRERGLLP